MSIYLKLISLNIEGDNHLNRVIPFLVKENPEVICLQEVFKNDTAIIAQKIGAKNYFFPMAKIVDRRYTTNSLRQTWGISILSKLPVKEIHSEEYHKGGKSIPSYSGGGGACNRILVWAHVVKGNQEFTIVTTHFTWSSKGNTTVIQRRSFKKLSQILDKVDECVLCGDFNAPRGGEIYSCLANRYLDNIPKNVKTTLDENLHRVKGLKIVVDGLFTSSSYRAENVKVIGGLSDHKAIVTLITTKE